MEHELSSPLICADEPSAAVELRTERAVKTVLTLFGTRPEIIKLYPVIQALERSGAGLRTVNVTSAQHTDLLYPLVRLFGVRLDHDLHVMEPGQSLNQLCAKVLTALEPILLREKPDLLLVQGDTTTALAGALAAFQQRIPVGHIEAGLRTGNLHSPYPEEMNRRLISQLATYHFAATARNGDTLLAEGVAPRRVFVTGNPVVDALQAIRNRPVTSALLQDVLHETRGFRRLVLTTHRRESFGAVLAGNLRVLRRFVERHADVVLIFPVHPNPAVRAATQTLLAGHQRIHLLDPLDYLDFIGLLSQAWLIVSDSGGIQEEAPSLGKRVLVLRDSTERPEAVEAGVAQLVGRNPERLNELLEEAARGEPPLPQGIANPFGDGDSGPRIAQLIRRLLDGEAREDGSS
jgi:UDP-N-acetylglucosamine 2-epimerase (non-hydrolysing)